VLGEELLVQSLHGLAAKEGSNLFLDDLIDNRVECPAGKGVKEPGSQGVNLRVSRINSPGLFDRLDNSQWLP